MQFIDLQTQQDRIRVELKRRMDTVLAHGKYILGPEVSELEERLADYTGSRYCVSCGNGTDALQVALMALEIQAGDEVIVPAFGYIAPAEVIALLGARPVYVDIEERSFNLNPAMVEEAITARTRAIIGLSLYGQCADYTAINEIADKYQLPVVEDAAQSFGARHNGRRSGNLSTIGCTSFFPTKPLGCYGDGGAIFTNEENLGVAIRQIARHGQVARYKHDRVGINSRLDTIQAAILLAKLEVFDDELVRRQQVADRYTSLIEDKSSPAIITPKTLSGNDSSWAQYTIRVRDRDETRATLDARRIPTSVHYPLPLTKQPAVACATSNVPVSDLASREVLSLPMHPYLDATQQTAVVDSLP